MNLEAKTKQAFLWTQILKTPFWTLYGFLVFFLYKDLHADPFQIALFVALKPIVSIFSIYWSAWIKERQDRLVSNIIAAGILGHLPFFFFPFIESSWFCIFAGALYMMLTRGIVPAWMEILKLNLGPNIRERVFAYGSAISYMGGIIIPLLIGNLFDLHVGLWKWFFPIASLLSLASLFFLLPIAPKILIKNSSAKVSLIAPWRHAFELCKKRPDFRTFQLGFMFGGAGLMLMQPALPQFFFGSLQISYEELAMALSLCKSLGFIATTKFWASWMARANIFYLSGFVTLLAAVFPVLLLMANFHLSWLYIAYLCYGVMQAGSELSWHLSGPIFAKNEESSVYSSVNVVTVGLRGLIAPWLGGILLASFGAALALIIGSLFCLFGMITMMIARKEKLSLIQN